MLFRVKNVPNAHSGRNGEWAVRYINQSLREKFGPKNPKGRMYTCRKDVWELNPVAL